MAKMLGFEIKNFKNYRGHEGETLSQGDVWFNGKKLGFWSMGDWGGCDNFDFNTKPFDDEIAKLAGGDIFPDWTNGITPDLGILLAKLADLKEVEKIYKKFVKQGVNIMVGASNGWHGIFYGTNLPADAPQKARDMIADAYQDKAANDLKSSKDRITMTVYGKEDFTVGGPLPIDRKVVKGISDECKAREKRMKEIYGF